MTKAGKTRTDWRKRFESAKAPHVVVLESRFAGVPAGARLLISSPGEIAAYVAAIHAAAMCPVTTAIDLRVVAEAALEDLGAGKDLAQVPPFWRVLGPSDKTAAKLSCGPEGVEHLRRLDLAGPGEG